MRRLQSPRRFIQTTCFLFCRSLEFFTRGKGRAKEVHRKRGRGGHARIDLLLYPRMMLDALYYYGFFVIIRCARHHFRRRRFEGGLNTCRVREVKWCLSVKRVGRIERAAGQEEVNNPPPASQENGQMRMVGASRNSEREKNDEFRLFTHLYSRRGNRRASRGWRRCSAGAPPCDKRRDIPR